MAWQTPKTNWASSDYFTIDPDYERIRGNILYVWTMGTSVYGAVLNTVMRDVTPQDVPTEEFPNAVVNSLQEFFDECIAPGGAQGMILYEGNGRAWNAAELNIIENNTLLAYNAVRSIYSTLPMLEFDLGVDEL